MQKRIIKYTKYKRKVTMLRDRKGIDRSRLFGKNGRIPVLLDCILCTASVYLIIKIYIYCITKDVTLSLLTLATLIFLGFPIIIFIDKIFVEGTLEELNDQLIQRGLIVSPLNIEARAPLNIILAIIWVLLTFPLTAVIYFQCNLPPYPTNFFETIFSPLCTMIVLSGVMFGYIAVRTVLLFCLIKLDDAIINNRLKNLRLKACEEKMNRWEKEGYDITPLKNLATDNHEGIVATFDEYERGVATLTRIETELRRMRIAHPAWIESPEFAPRVKAVEMNVRNPSKAAEVERNCAQLRQIVDRLEKGIGSLKKHVDDR